MTFPILGGNSAVTGVAQTNSLRFNDDDSPNLSRTPSSAGNRKTFTLSTWIKRSNLSDGAIIGARSSSTNRFRIGFTSNRLDVLNVASSTTYNLTTTMLFRDVSAWYHIVVAYDTTQSNSSDRIKIYVNGSQQTSFVNSGYPPQNTDTDYNNTFAQYVGTNDDASGEFFDGYFAELHLIDGTAKAPTDFGEFDSTSGIWKVKEYEGSYGTNGFKLDFSDSGSLGADSSGNGNDFTPTNLTSTDQTTDTPTNNFATWNSLIATNGQTLAEGNTQVSSSSGDLVGGYSTIGMSSGKWFAEFKISAYDTNRTILGILSNPSESDRTDTNIFNATYGAGLYYDGTVRINASTVATVGSITLNDVIGVAVNLDDNNILFYINGVVQNSGTPLSITASSSTDTGNYFFSTGDGSLTAFSTVQANFGNPPFSISSGNSDGNGYGNFEYAPPSGYLALCTQNLATELSPTIDDGSQYFNTLTWTGTGSARSITGLGFSPDLVWIKDRSAGSSHVLYDIIRGAQKQLSSDNTSAELTRAGVTAFDSDGFSLGTYANVNQNNLNFVGWNWRGSDSSAVSNTDGTNASTVSANQTAGFSIVSYTRDGNSTTTVGHGLGIKPQILIEKDRDTGGTNWAFITTAIDGTDDYSFLNTTNAFGATTADAFTTTTFRSSMGANQGDIISYCFAPIEGYSKFGSYTGSGVDNDGPMVYLGFKPSFLMVKNASNTGEWGMFDSKRNTFNVVNARLSADSYGAEYSGDSNRDFDFLSNGFKVRNGSADVFNTSGDSFLYMCFASNPLVDSNGVPNTAR